MGCIIAQIRVTNPSDDDKSFLMKLFLSKWTGIKMVTMSLIGYVILEQAQAVVDMPGHWLVPVKYIECK